jgi:hypothetical protein
MRQVASRGARWAIEGSWIRAVPRRPFLCIAAVRAFMGGEGFDRSDDRVRRFAVSTFGDSETPLAPEAILRPG